MHFLALLTGSVMLVHCQAIPRILQGEDVVIAAETGGGKTLAYLLPVLHKLSQLPPDHSSHLPVALVLTASADLVRQLATVVHDVAPTLAATALALPSANASKPLGPLVIATPRALLRASSPRDFAFTEVVVVDEADMLLGGGFEKDTKQLLATIRNQPLLRRELNDGERRSFVRDDNEEEDDDNIDDRDSIRPEDISPERTQVVFSAISSLRVLSACFIACIARSTAVSLTASLAMLARPTPRSQITASARSGASSRTSSPTPPSPPHPSVGWLVHALHLRCLADDRCEVNRTFSARCQG